MERRQQQLDANEQLPLLSNVMKKLYFKVHPDRFGTAPEEVRRTNEDSFQRLSGFMGTIRAKEDHLPPADVQRLRFFVKEEGDELREVELVLRTTGGNCKNVVAKSLGEFFAQVGLPERFEWDPGMWGYNLSLEQRRVTSHTDDEELYRQQEMLQEAEELVSEARAVRVTHAACMREGARPVALTTPPLPRSQQMLQAIAAVPYLGSEHALARRAQNDFLRTLSERGYNLRGAVERVWQGERDEDALVGGMNVVERRMVQEVVKFSKEFDVQSRRVDA